MSKNDPILDGIAIIGTAGRFPGASSVADFWRNQCNGVESISHFSTEQIRAHRWLWGIGNGWGAFHSGCLSIMFDAAFFGINPKEAELLDPQHRVFLECCWEAIENAGY